jgi:hypothetical protein
MVVLIGMTAVQPVTLPVVAIPMLAIVVRVGGEAQGLSVSDFMLAIALVPAVLLVRHPYHSALRQMLWLLVVYQATTVLTVVANPYLANAVEWVHAAMLVGGAAVVGWAVGVTGKARPALGALLAVCAAIAVLTCIAALIKTASGDPDPVYLEFPYGMHKNFIGALLAFAAVIVYARPDWLGWSRKWTYPALGLFLLAIFASQARQAIISVAVGIAVVAVRSGQGKRRPSKVMLLACIAPIVFAITVVQEQIEEGNPFNSYYQRLTWYEQSIDLWQQAPWFGAGLRWWYTGRYDMYFQPPNVFLETLTTSGIVGLLGFLVLIAGSIVVLWRLDPRFGTMAVALVLTRLTQGQFDLFWTAVHVSIPFAVAGICIGAAARAERVGAQEVHQADSRISSYRDRIRGHV